MQRRIVASALVLASVGALSGAGASAARNACDLQVELRGLPSETRVGGSVTYEVTLRNRGPGRARSVSLAVDGGAVLASVLSRGLACSTRPEFHVHCSAGIVRPGTGATLELAVRPTRLGTFHVTARASTSTREATPKNNASTVSTRVRPADSVHAVGSRVILGLPTQFKIEAVSAAHGQDVAGSFSLDSEVAGGKHEVTNGRVLCLSVVGKRANVGVVIDDSSTGAPPGTVPVTQLLFQLTDNGSPGAGRDSLTFAGGEGVGFKCFLGGFGGTTITSGDIAVHDTP
jgi:hypothetical protein